MQAFHDAIIIPSFNFDFELKNDAEEGGEIQIFEYHQNKKNFLDEIKSIYHYF